ncbi:glycosyltransferase family 2 protein [Arenicella sp. 4NH20-0111]|uniref:glycosyltransferase family 2 protein n=1 Tax=Arenicella sp. 4NH20-0111 TaxID=3127648 RepID=UPI00333E6927
MPPSSTSPSVSIVIPCFNEQGFIKPCLTSLLDGVYPHDKIEIILVDGGSTDNTLKEVGSLEGKPFNITIIHNPKKITPAAMNIGIEAASNDIIMWCGAHALYDSNYVSISIKTLLETNCASVGGVISPIAKTITGNAIAVATTHQFGIGNAKYRYSTRRQSVDTVFGGCFTKTSVEKIGGFDEKWIRNQDFEFNYRLRKHIGKIILEPTIRCNYYCRETIHSLSKQYFQYGYWRCKTSLKHPGSMSFRQLIPVALNLGLIASAILILIGGNATSVGFVLPVVYMTANLAASAHLSIKNKSASLITRLPFIFPSIHISWGAGFLFSAASHYWDKIRNTIIGNG